MSKAPYLTPDLIRNGIDILTQLIHDAENVPCPNFRAYRDPRLLGFWKFDDEDVYGKLILIRDRAVKVTQKVFGNSKKKTVLLLKNVFNHDPYLIQNYRQEYYSIRSVEFEDEQKENSKQMCEEQEARFVKYWHRDKERFINLLKEMLEELKLLRKKEKGSTMAKNEIRLGDGTTIYGDFVTANSIKSSFNRVNDSEIPAELKETLTALAKSVAKMVETLPDEKAQKVTQDLEVLTSEAISKVPRKQWISLSAEGLKQAAKNIGEIGKPVIELVGKILPLLIART